MVSHILSGLARPAKMALAGGILAILAACGSGNKDDESGGGTPPPPVADKPASTTEAARFLAQATMGPTEAATAELMNAGYSAWFDAQFAKPQKLHKTYADERLAALRATDPNANINQNTFFEGWWQQAITGDDQLRQRVAFALSQHFVISFQDANVGQYPRGVASYYDMLAKNAFGNFRTLMEDVSLHPMMGLYLTSRGNQKEDPARGRVPDENYAREIMQLFTIGIYQLNNDGTVKMNGSTPLETYTFEDIAGLAKVFTGFSWYAGPAAADRTDSRFFGGNGQMDRDWQPMQSYAKFHSTSEKKFLGTTIAAQGTANPEASLKTALDTLFNHPNVGPFLATNLIKQLVTSNPSPAYIGRVAAAFNNNGAGVRGDMKAVIKAIFMDSEARTLSTAATAGKLREPVMRLANFMRAMGHTSQTGRFTLGATDDPGNSLSQTPMRSPSVFNFWRPGYVPPSSALAAANVTAPEMQIVQEVSVRGYFEFMRQAVEQGVGSNAPAPATGRDIRTTYAPEMALADKPDQLVERMNNNLMYGQMPAALKTAITTAVNSVAIPSGANVTQAQIDAAKLNRVRIATYLTVASPDFLTLK
ncbi:MAG: DUF1800 domain-containing protein [Burkholderiaceae bacterium]